MPESFDPYRKWLGIPQEEQPPHHYRLLGIAIFEDDPDVISNAADRQMAHVRTYQSGKYADKSQQLLNELSTAKVSLLNPDKRKAYDAELKAKLAETAPPESGVSPGAASPAITPPAPTRRAPAAPPPPAPPPSSPPPPRELAVPRDASARPVSAEVAAPMAVETVAPVAMAEAPRTAAVRPIPVATVAGASPVSVPTRVASASTRARARRQSSMIPMIFGLGALGGLGFIVLFIMIVASSGESTVPEVTETEYTSTTPLDRPVDVRPSPTRPDRRERPDRRDRSRPEFPRPEFETHKPLPLVPSEQSDGVRSKELAAALASTIDALAKRDLSAAAAQISAAEKLQQTAIDISDVDGVRSLYELHKRFWEGVRSGAGHLRENAEVGFGSKIATFVGKEGDDIKLLVQGGEQIFPLTELDGRYLVTFAERGLKEKSNPRERLAIAAFLAIDAQSQNSECLRHAQKLYNSARDEGAANGHLEVRLANAMTAVASKNDEEVASNLPRPADDTNPPGEETLPSLGDLANVDQPNAAVARKAVPTAEEKRRAMTKLQSRYKIPNNKKEFEELASLLSADAAAETDDEAVRYVLLEKLRDVRRHLLDVAGLMVVIDDLGRDYDIDTASEKAASLGQLAGSADKNLHATIAEFAWQAEQQAVLEKQYAGAAALARTTIRSARSAGLNELARRADKHASAFDEFVDEEKKFQKALANFKRNQDDPVAAAAVGRFLILFQGDWKRGLAVLAQSSEAEYGPLAKREVEGKLDPKAQAELAEGWYDASRRRDGLAKEQLLRHSAELYTEVVPRLDGIEKEKAQGRLTEINEALTGGILTLGLP